MNKFLLKDIPTRCTSCDSLIHTAAPRAKLSTRALLIGFAGIPATAIWVILFFLFSDFSGFYISSRRIGGMLLCALLYGWPLYVCVLLARKLPEVVYNKCFKCKKQEVFEVEMPKM